MVLLVDRGGSGPGLVVGLGVGRCGLWGGLVVGAAPQLQQPVAGVGQAAAGPDDLGDPGGQAGGALLDRLRLGRLLVGGWGSGRGGRCLLCGGGGQEGDQQHEHRVLGQGAGQGPGAEAAADGQDGQGGRGQGEDDQAPHGQAGGWVVAVTDDGDQDQEAGHRGGRPPPAQDRAAAWRRRGGSVSGPQPGSRVGGWCISDHLASGGWWWGGHQGCGGLGWAARPSKVGSGMAPPTGLGVGRARPAAAAAEGDRRLADVGAGQAGDGGLGAAAQRQPAAHAAGRPGAVAHVDLPDHGAGHTRLLPGMVGGGRDGGLGPVGEGLDELRRSARGRSGGGRRGCAGAPGGPRWPSG